MQGVMVREKLGTPGKEGRPECDREER